VLPAGKPFFFSTLAPTAHWPSKTHDVEKKSIPHQNARKAFDKGMTQA
jgi:hypothetical protein